MDQEQTAEPDQNDNDGQDRVVSRRVRNPTDAEPGDDAVYQAANSGGDDSGDDTSGRSASADGLSTESAAAELDEENESEPVRSE